MTAGALHLTLSQAEAAWIEVTGGKNLQEVQMPDWWKMRIRERDYKSFEEFLSVNRIEVCDEVFR